MIGTQGGPGVSGSVSLCNNGYHRVGKRGERICVKNEITTTARTEDVTPNSASPCFINQCENGGICENSSSGYNCICPENYSGTNCELELCGDTFYNPFILECCSDSTLAIIGLVCLNKIQGVLISINQSGIKPS